MPYRIRIEKIETVADTEAKWQRGGPNATSPEHNAYELPPAGATKTLRTDIYDQTLDELDVRELVSFINAENK